LAGRAATSSDELSRPRALIVSDVMLFREGLRAGLDRLGLLDIVAATSPDGARAVIARQRVDVVILDASRRRALERAAAFGREWPHLKLVAFGICSQQDLLAGAEFGINAFVGEDGEVADINRAALMALRGESYCSPKETACLIEHIACLAQNFVRSVDGRLTHREREVASMVGRGLSNKEIALELRISPATVKNHVHNILEKSNLPSRSAIGGRLEQRHMRFSA
jgi:two-component system nitrate/nitrite response regulator NarL